MKLNLSFKMEKESIITTKNEGCKLSPIDFQFDLEMTETEVIEALKNSASVNEMMISAIEQAGKEFAKRMKETEHEPRSGGLCGGSMFGKMETPKDPKTLKYIDAGVPEFINEVTTAIRKLNTPAPETTETVQIRSNLYHTLMLPAVQIAVEELKKQNITIKQAVRETETSTLLTVEF